MNKWYFQEHSLASLNNHSESVRMENQPLPPQAGVLLMVTQRRNVRQQSCCLYLLLSFVLPLVFSHHCFDRLSQRCSLWPIRNLWSDAKSVGLMYQWREETKREVRKLGQQNVGCTSISGPVSMTINGRL